MGNEIGGAWSPRKRACIVVASGWLALLSEGCATVESGAYASPMDARGHLAKSPVTPLGVRVSGTEIGRLSSPYFGVLAFTFENTSPRWIHVRKVGIGFGDALKDQNVLLPWGEELSSVERASVERAEIHDANETTALSVVAAVGAVGAAAGHHLGGGQSTALTAVGGLATAGALAGLLAEHANGVTAGAEQPPPFPDTHLLAVPFSIPPGLFAKRWLVLNTPADAKLPCVDALRVDYELDTGQVEHVWLRFRNATSASEWQAEACGSSSAHAHDQPGG